MVTSIQVLNLAEKFEVPSYYGLGCTVVSLKWSKNFKVLKNVAWNQQKSIYIRERGVRKAI
jgi:hypothetical protein